LVFFWQYSKRLEYAVTASQNISSLLKFGTSLYFITFIVFELVTPFNMNVLFITTDPATPETISNTPVFDEGEAFQGSRHSSNEVRAAMIRDVDEDG
jgi:hypothetical protein